MNERRAKMKFFTVFASLFSIHISFPSVCILRFESLDSTKQAFQNSGFENANLSLSYADTSSGSFAQGERQQSSEQFFSNKVYGDYASSAEISGAASSQAAYSADSDRKISVVA